MGLRPTDIDPPRVGEFVQLAYEVNGGAASSFRGEAAGTVSEILTTADGEFVGFKIAGPYLKTAHTGTMETLIVKAQNPKREVNVKMVMPDGRKEKVNAIPGAVNVNPSDYGRDDAQREPVQ